MGSGEEKQGRLPRNRRILVVDDNRDNAAGLERLLRMCGYDVTVVHTGGEAIEAAARLVPAFVLCDLGLPDKHGFDVARELRQNGVTADIELIAVTGYGDETDRRRAREAGFDAHFTKPVDPDDLLKHLDSRRA